MAPKSIKELEELIEKLKKAYEQLNKEVPLDLKKPTEEIRAYYGSVEKAYQSLDTQLKGAKAEIVEVESGLSGLKDRFKDISRELGKNYGDPYKNSLKSFEKIIRYAEDLSDIQYDLGANSLKDTNLLKEKVNLEFRKLNLQLDSLENQKAELEEEKKSIKNSELDEQQKTKEIAAIEKKLVKVEELQNIAKEDYKSLEEKIGYQDKFNEALDKTYKRQKNIHNAVGITGKLIGGLGKSLEKLGFEDFTTEIDIAKKKMFQLANEITDNGNKAAGFTNTIKIGLTGLSSLGKSMLSSLSDPLVVLTLMVKTIKSLISLVSEFKKGESEVGKAFGIAGKEAQNTYNTIRQSQDLYHFPDELLSGQKKFNEAVGFNLEYNKENAAAMVDLTQYLGVSDETAGKLLRRSELLGGSFKSNDKAMARITTEFNKQNKTAVPYSKVIDRIANASSAATFNIKNGVKGLTEAAASAARYGRSIDDIKNSAESLLNFEDSISKELETELLIGKDLNLEKLRYAALTGDIKTQEAEQSRLIRENFKYLKGNVIAQKAFAASLGMELDTVAKIAEQQELEAKMTPKQLKAHQDSLELQAKQAKEAEAFNRQFNNAINALKTALLPIIQGITPLFITMAEMAGKMANSLNGVGKFLSGDTGKMLMKILGVGAAVGGGAFLVAKIANFIKGAKDTFSGGVFTPKEEAKDKDKPGTKKKTLLERMMGGKGTLGDSKNNPLYVYVVNQGGGGSLGDDGYDDYGGDKTRRDKRNKRNKRNNQNKPRRGKAGLNIADAAIDAAPSSSSTTTAPRTAATRSISPRTPSSSTTTKSGGFFTKLYEKGSNILNKAAKSISPRTPSSSTTTAPKTSATRSISPRTPSSSTTTAPKTSATRSISPRTPSSSTTTAPKAKKGIFGKLGKFGKGIFGKMGAKGLGKLIPNAGVIMALSNLAEGDYFGAGLNATAGIASLFPGVGTAVAAGLTGLDITRSIVGTLNASEDTELATGGIVTKPTRALVGEKGKEVILPIEKAPGIIAKTIEQSPSLVSFNNQSFNTPSSTTNDSNRKMEQIMSSILDTLNQINNKEGIINLDGSKVGTGLVMTNFRS